MQESWDEKAWQIMDGKAKPVGSLGLLEEWAVRLSNLQHTMKPHVDQATLLIFAADHGISAAVPSVSAYPRQLTSVVFRAIATGGAASATLCQANNCDLLLVDAGIDGDVSSSTGASLPGCNITVRHNKLAYGSSSMLDGPALTSEQCAAALKLGADTVQGVIDQSPSGPTGAVICIGEVGIANTTCAAALVAALTGLPAAKVCGRGTGVDDRGLGVKVAVVSKALQLHQEAILKGGARAALEAVGGLELAAMVGAYLEASRQSLPVIVDGFISGAAALVAVGLDPSVRRCLFLSHHSMETGARVVLSALSTPPRGSNPQLDAKHEPARSPTAAAAPSSGSTGGSQQEAAGSEGRAVAAQAVDAPLAALDMGLRLGEGSGAVLCVPLLKSAAAIMSNFKSLSEVMGVPSEGAADPSVGSSARDAA